jgi:hypothetical protein
VGAYASCGSYRVRSASGPSSAWEVGPGRLLSDFTKAHIFNCPSYLESALVRHYRFEIVATVPSTFVSAILNFSL